MSKKRAASSSPSASPRAKAASRPFSSPSSVLPRRGEVELEHGGLSLVPRLRVLLSFARADLSVKPLDEWQLRQSLLSFLRDSLSIMVSDRDLSLHKHRNPHKRRRDEALASGVLYIWDIQALLGESKSHRDDSDNLLQEKEKMLIEKLKCVELNLGGLKLQCLARPEDRDDFLSLKHSWHRANDNHKTGFPDTMVLRGIPSRWLAEPRVSPKASVLVTHTIFSQFGSIRNLDIQVNDSESLSCNVWVQYEHYSEFYDAMVAFCGRSMAKEGSNFKATYEVSWDNEGYFTEGNIRKRKFEKEHLEDLRRRQAFVEARQADIARRQTEHARVEQERKEAERLERLREEDNWRRERAAALAEEEMLRQRELERSREEEILRKERIQKENAQREEEQRAFEIRRREEELWRQEEQMKEKQRAGDKRDRETWTQQSPRYGSPEIMHRNHLDLRRDLGGTSQEREGKWPQKFSFAGGTNGQHESYKRENVSRFTGDQSATKQLDVNNDDFMKDEDLQRWSLDTGPYLSSKYGDFKRGSEVASQMRRLKSVVVDSRQVM